MNKTNEQLIAALAGIAKEAIDRLGDHIYFHKWSHTSDMLGRAVLFGNDIDLNEREMLVLVTSVLFHDVRQEGKFTERPDGSVTFERYVGANERASSEAAFAAAAKVGLKLTSSEKGIIKVAHIATIPGWNREFSTVEQPYLQADTHPIARITALSDLCIPGMNPAAFLTEGLKLFLETEVDIARMLETTESSGQVSLEKRDWYRERFLRFLSSQIAYAEGRKLLTPGEILGFEGRYRPRIASRLSLFDASIHAANVMHMQARKLDFLPLMRLLSRDAFPADKK